MTAEAEEDIEFGHQAGECPEPQDRGKATLTDLGKTEYIEDWLRPGRIVVVAAEESTGKSYLAIEASIRLTTKTGSFAQTWEIRDACKVLYLSEMHTDDDYEREEVVLASLEKTRADIDGKFFRLSIFDAANGSPPLGVAEWMAYITQWTLDNDIRVLIIDTVTTAIAKPSWGEDLMALFSALRRLLALNKALAIILVVHMTKPTGGAERGLSAVMGEYGRFNDVTILMQNDGKSLTRVKLTVRKRVRQERRLIFTKAGGLLTDPVDIGKGGTKVDTSQQMAAIETNPGLTILDLAKALNVHKSTAERYVKNLGDAVQKVEETIDNKGVYRLYPAEATLAR